MNPDKRKLLLKEIVIKATRSSGPGGQHVNKVSTKVELRFNINQSTVLSEKEKYLVGLKLANKISDSGELILSDQSSRSQLQNKTTVINRFIYLIDFALKLQTKRIPTKRTRGSQLRRLDSKKKLSEKKEQRRKLGD